MASTPRTILQLQRLVLSASELKQLTGWDNAVIQDYLNILDNIIYLANTLDEKSGIIKNTEVVSNGSYELNKADQVIFADTSVYEIMLQLPEGEDGLDFRIINASNAGNNVVIYPYGDETVFYSSDSFTLYSDEAVDMVYRSGYGWL